MFSDFSITEMKELADALRGAGFTSADIIKLMRSSNLLKLKEVFNGNAEIVVRKHIIDLDAEPFCPDGWKVKEHHRGGQLEFDIQKIKLYLADRQKGRVLEGNGLRKELEDMPTLNANVLDYLLSNPQLIPEEWKGDWVFFWGTIYCHSEGRLCVRCLCWRGSEWVWRYGWLSDSFDDDAPTILLASQLDLRLFCFLNFWILGLSFLKSKNPRVRILREDFKIVYNKRD